MSAATERLISMAAERIPGVDWDALQKQGKRSVYQDAYIRRYLLPAAFAAGRVEATLAPIDVSLLETREQVRAVRDALNIVDEKAARVVDAAEGGWTDFASDLSSAIQMPGPVLTALVTGAYRTASYGVLLHTSRVMADAAVFKIEQAQLTWRATPRETDEQARSRFEREVMVPEWRAIADHADMCVRTLNGIVMLDKRGVLDSLKRNGTSGLGVIPVAVVVGIVAVLVATVVAYLAYAATTLREDQKNRLKVIEKMCEDAQRKGDTTIQKKCLEVLNDPNRGIATVVERFGQQLVWGLLALTGAGLVVYSAPAIVSRFRTARRA